MAANFSFNTPITMADDFSPDAPITCEDVDSRIIQGVVPTIAPASQEVLDSISGAPPAARVEQPMLAHAGLPVHTNEMAECSEYLAALPDGKLIRPPPGLPMPKGMVPSAHQSATVGHPKIFVPGPPFLGERPSTKDDLQFISTIDRFGIKISPHLAVKDIDLEEMTYYWLQYLKGFHAHLVDHPHEQRGQEFVDHVDGLRWLVEELNEIMQRSSNPSYARPAPYSTREFFPVSMQGKDRLSPLEQARLAIVLLGEARFGDYLAQLADWPYQPSPTIPRFYSRDGQLEWKPSTTQDCTPHLYGTLDTSFLGAFDYIQSLGGEETLFLNRSLVIETQRPQELQDSENQPDKNEDNNKAKPHYRCDRWNGAWDDSSFEYDSNPAENFKKPSYSNPSTSNSGTFGGSTAPSSCSEHSSDATNSGSSSLGSSDSDLIGFNDWQDFGVEDESGDEEGVEYWGDTPELDPYSLAPNGPDDSSDLERQDFGGYEQQSVDDDDDEEVEEDIAYFGDDEDSDGDDDDDEPSLSPVDQVRSVIEILQNMLSDIDALVDSASEPEETPSPELEEIDLAFAHNWYRQAQRVNHGEDDEDDDDDKDPEWLDDQDVEPWDTHSPPQAFLVDMTAYLNRVDQTISDKSCSATKYCANDGEHDDDDVSELCLDQDIVNHTVGKGEEYHEGHHDEYGENDEDPEWYSDGGDEPSDTDDGDEPSDDDSSGSETEQQPDDDGPWLPIRQPWPAQHALYGFQSRHEAFLLPASPIFMHRLLQSPIQLPAASQIASEASRPTLAAVPSRPALQHDPRMTISTILNSSLSSSSPAVSVAETRQLPQRQGQGFVLRGSANFHDAEEGLQDFLRGTWRQPHRPLWNAMVEGTARKNQRAARSECNGVPVN